MNIAPKILSLYILCSIRFHCYSQIIPYGITTDSITLSTGHKYEIYYYKPPLYDSVISPIILNLHGSGGTGLEAVYTMDEIADRRKALIVGPTNLFPSWGYYDYDTLNTYYFEEDSIIAYWSSQAFKEVYRHVLERENRDSIPVYFIGFSAGGQSVNRHMLIRQAIPDSIPIMMAISASPGFFTFCTEQYNGVCQPWPCGLLFNKQTNFYPDNSYQRPPEANFICDEHVLQFYNENYGIVVGTLDDGFTGGGVLTCNCISAQSNLGRYDRALNYFAFSSDNAVERGAVLNWQFVGISGIGHSSYQLFAEKASPTDSFTIVETILFDSPYAPPTTTFPSANIYYKTNPKYCNRIDFVASCSYNKLPVTTFWDFGDGATSAKRNLTHTYSAIGTYKVTLIVSNSQGADTSIQNITIDKLPPIADFTVNISAVYLLSFFPVHFFNNSINAYYFYWNFGDGTTSTAAAPSHIYLSEDTFSIGLIAVGNNGCADLSVKENYIIVNDSLCSDLVSVISTGNTGFCEGDSVLINVSENYLSYQWSNGETNNSIYAKNTAFYSVTVTDLNSCSHFSDSVLVSVFVNPPIPGIFQNADTLISTPANNYQWYLNENALLNDTAQTLIISEPGFYSVQTFHINGCSSFSDSVYVVKTGEEFAVHGSGFRIFPNPNEGKFIVELPSSDPIAIGFHLPSVITIYNLLGEKIYEQQFSLNKNPIFAEIDLSEHASGIYFLYLRCADFVKTEKLIIH